MNVWNPDIVFFSLATLCAVIALRAPSLLISGIALGVFSYLSALIYASLAGVDVGFNEAVLGAGITSIFLLAALFHRQRQHQQTSAPLNPWVIAGHLGIILSFAAILFYAGSTLPLRGEGASSALASAASQYLLKASPEIHSPNVVTAIIADFRSFDTLGETLVVFTAAMACLLILGELKKREPSHLLKATYSPIIAVTMQLIVPFIQLFAFYVIVHGHYGPGGGFQGGALLGVSFILSRLFLAPAQLGPWMSPRAVYLWAALGLLIYVGVGALSIINRGAFLNYAQIPWQLAAADLRSLGVLVVEIGVAFTVMASMLAIFDSLSAAQSMPTTKS